MLNIYDYRKAKKELLEEHGTFLDEITFYGIGLAKLKIEGQYLYPDLVIKEYQAYRNWVKTYRPKLP